MKKVLVLGAGGQLGKAVILHAPKSIGLASRARKELDLLDTQSLLDILDSIKPDVIINCAAYTAVDAAEKEMEQAFATNAYAVGNLAKHVSEETRLIHVSTDFVFSEPSDHCYLPTDNTSPSSVYGKSKLEGEVLLQKYHKHNFVILRTSWLYSSTGKNFVNTMLRLMESRTSLNVVNDQYGSPTSVDSLAPIIWQIALVDQTEGVFHWSDHGVTTWYDFAVEIYRQGRQSGLIDHDVTINPISTREYPTPARRPEYSALDSTQTEALLGVKCTPWQTELAKVISRIKELRT